MDEWQAAWDAILERLPDDWHTGRARYDRASRRWHAVALPRGPLGQRDGPSYVIGEGEDEVAALRDLAERLRAA